MRTVFDIANYFLAKSSMTNKKLQKLCYYAQAWHCAFYKNKPIFEDRIEAWVHGPVSPKLYAKYSSCGRNEIPQDIESVKQINFTRKELNILNQVWDIYGVYDGDELEMLSHSEEPWKNAREGLNELEISNNEITYEVMGNYYRDLLNGK